MAEGIIISVILLLASFFLLAKIVDGFFVESLDLISKKLNLSSDIAGATFMAVGSSAPELFISILALIRGGESSEMGMGTVVGSALFNILVIVGVSSLFKPAKLTWQPVIRDLIFYVGSILLLLFTFLDGKIVLTEGIILISYYGFYLLSFKFWKKIFPYKDYVQNLDSATEKENLEKRLKKENRDKNFAEKILSFIFPDLKKKPNLYFLTFGISITLIAGISFVLVESAVAFAEYAGMNQALIGLTILAAGTSIPDLLSSVIVAKHGKGDMAVANAVGSNIFDIQVGLGVPWLIIGLTGSSVIVGTENLAASIILLFATVVALLGILIAKKWMIGRFAGLVLIAMYVLYIISAYFGWIDRISF